MNNHLSIEPGYYYHYKHDPKGVVNNYAYRVFGVGHHTEKDCRPEDELMMVYRPLYEAYVYTHGKMFDLRPLAMALETVEKDGVAIPRFKKITDEATITALREIEKEMYQ